MGFTLREMRTSGFELRSSKILLKESICFLCVGFRLEEVKGRTVWRYLESR